jgi:hypothetical protein
MTVILLMRRRAHRGPKARAMPHLIGGRVTAKNNIARNALTAIPLFSHPDSGHFVQTVAEWQHASLHIVNSL